MAKKHFSIFVLYRCSVSHGLIFWVEEKKAFSFVTNHNNCQRTETCQPQPELLRIYGGWIYQQGRRSECWKRRLKSCCAASIQSLTLHCLRQTSNFNLRCFTLQFNVWTQTAWSLSVKSESKLRIITTDDDSCHALVYIWIWVVYILFLHIQCFQLLLIR